MVGRYLIIALLILLPIRLYAVSADDLRSMSSDNERDRQARQGRAKTSDLSPLMGSDKSSSDKADNKAPKRFTKKKKTTSTTPVVSSKTSSSVDGGKTTREEQIQAEVPIPPVPGQQTMVSDAIKPSTSFGIRLGTWMEGNINRNTSNAEPGLVEITLTADIIGDKKTLKTGTLLFAQKQFNASTKRLEMMVQKGITPSGQEFKIAGLIFDTQKVSGLSGIVDMDNANSVKRGASKGLIAAAGTAAAKSAAGATPFGSAASASVDSVLQDQSNVVEQTTGQQLTIYVSPQPLLIRVDQTF